MARGNTTRRRLLALSGAVAGSGLAGCVGDDADDASGSEEDGSPGDDSTTDDGTSDDAEHALRVTVEDDRGEPMEGVPVRLQGEADETSDESEETDGDGRAEFAVEDGKYTVVAGEGSETGTDVEIDDGDEELTIAIEPGLTVETAYNSREEYARPGDTLDYIDDFSEWDVTAGEAEEDDDVAFEGDRSVRLHTGESEGNVVIERAVEPDLDLTDRDVSLAVRTTTPERITLELRFVDIYGTSRIHWLRTITHGTRDVGWFRSCPGVVETDDEPAEMDAIDRFEITIHNTGPEAEVWIDDLRVHERPDAGYVVLVWDDGFRDFYDPAGPLHDEYGVNAVQSVVHHWTETEREGVMTVEELLERQEEGDQIIAHGTHTSFDELEPEELEESLRADKEWAVERGFEGAGFVTYPHNNYDATVLEIVSDYYYAGGFNQAGDTNLTGVYGFDPLVLPRTIGHDLEVCKTCIDLAVEHNQCTILNFHEFHLDNTVNEEEYEELLAYVADSDVEAITLEELWEMRTENH